jgi:hypothetical protein
MGQIVRSAWYYDVAVLWRFLATVVESLAAGVDFTWIGQDGRMRESALAFGTSEDVKGIAGRGISIYLESG